MDEGDTIVCAASEEDRIRFFCAHTGEHLDTACVSTARDHPSLFVQSLRGHPTRTGELIAIVNHKDPCFPLKLTKIHRLTSRPSLGPGAEDAAGADGEAADDVASSSSSSSRSASAAAASPTRKDPVSQAELGACAKDTPRATQHLVSDAASLLCAIPYPTRSSDPLRSVHLFADEPTPDVLAAAGLLAAGATEAASASADATQQEPASGSAGEAAAASPQGEPQAEPSSKKARPMQPPVDRAAALAAGVYTRKRCPPTSMGRALADVSIIGWTATDPSAEPSAGVCARFRCSAHSAILAARCPALAAQLRPALPEDDVDTVSVVALPRGCGVGMAELQTALCFVYTDTLRLPEVGDALMLLRTVPRPSAVVRDEVSAPDETAPNTGHASTAADVDAMVVESTVQSAMHPAWRPILRLSGPDAHPHSHARLASAFSSSSSAAASPGATGSASGRAAAASATPSRSPPSSPGLAASASTVATPIVSLTSADQGAGAAFSLPGSVRLCRERAVTDAASLTPLSELAPLPASDVAALNAATAPSSSSSSALSSSAGGVASGPSSAYDLLLRLDFVDPYPLGTGGAAPQFSGEDAAGAKTERRRGPASLTWAGMDSRGAEFAPPGQWAFPCNPEAAAVAAMDDGNGRAADIGGADATLAGRSSALDATAPGSTGRDDVMPGTSIARQASSSRSASAASAPLVTIGTNALCPSTAAALSHLGITVPRTFRKQSETCTMVATTGLPAVTSHALAALHTALCGARALGLPRMAALCAARLARLLTVETWEDIACLSVAHELPSLFRAATEFVAAAAPVLTAIGRLPVGSDGAALPGSSSVSLGPSMRERCGIQPAAVSSSHAPEPATAGQVVSTADSGEFAMENLHAAVADGSEAASSTRTPALVPASAKTDPAEETEADAFAEIVASNAALLGSWDSHAEARELHSEHVHSSAAEAYARARAMLRRVPGEAALLASTAVLECGSAGAAVAAMQVEPVPFDSRHGFNYALSARSMPGVDSGLGINADGVYEQLRNFRGDLSALSQEVGLGGPGEDISPRLLKYAQQMITDASKAAKEPSLSAANGSVATSSSNPTPAGAGEPGDAAASDDVRDVDSLADAVSLAEPAAATDVMTSLKERANRHGLDFATLSSFVCHLLPLSRGALRPKNPEDALSQAKAYLAWVLVDPEAALLRLQGGTVHPALHGQLQAMLDEQPDGSHLAAWGKRLLLQCVSIVGSSPLVPIQLQARPASSAYMEMVENIAESLSPEAVRAAITKGLAMPPPLSGGADAAAAASAGDDDSGLGSGVVAVAQLLSGEADKTVLVKVDKDAPGARDESGKWMIESFPLALASSNDAVLYVQRAVAGWLATRLRHSGHSTAARIATALATADSPVAIMLRRVLRPHGEVGAETHAGSGGQPGTWEPHWFDFDAYRTVLHSDPGLKEFEGSRVKGWLHLSSACAWALGGLTGSKSTEAAAAVANDDGGQVVTLGDAHEYRRALSLLIALLQPAVYKAEWLCGLHTPTPQACSPASVATGAAGSHPPPRQPPLRQRQFTRDCLVPAVGSVTAPQVGPGGRLVVHLAGENSHQHVSPRCVVAFDVATLRWHRLPTFGPAPKHPMGSAAVSLLTPSPFLPSAACAPGPLTLPGDVRGRERRASPAGPAALPAALALRAAAWPQPRFAVVHSSPVDNIRGRVCIFDSATLTWRDVTPSAGSVGEEFEGYAPSPRRQHMLVDVSEPQAPAWALSPEQALARWVAGSSGLEALPEAVATMEEMSGSAVGSALAIDEEAWALEAGGLSDTASLRAVAGLVTGESDDKTLPPERRLKLRATDTGAAELPSSASRLSSAPPPQPAAEAAAATCPATATATTGGHIPAALLSPWTTTHTIVAYGGYNISAPPGGDISAILQRDVDVLIITARHRLQLEAAAEGGSRATVSTTFTARWQRPKLLGTRPPSRLAAGAAALHLPAEEGGTVMLCIAGQSRRHLFNDALCLKLNSAATEATWHDTDRRGSFPGYVAALQVRAIGSRAVAIVGGSGIHGQSSGLSVATLRRVRREGAARATASAYILTCDNVPVVSRMPMIPRAYHACAVVPRSSRARTDLPGSPAEPVPDPTDDVGFGSGFGGTAAPLGSEQHAGDIETVELLVFGGTAFVAGEELEHGFGDSRGDRNVTRITLATSGTPPESAGDGSHPFSGQSFRLERMRNVGRRLSAAASGPRVAFGTAGAVDAFQIGPGEVQAWDRILAAATPFADAAATVAEWRLSAKLTGLVPAIASPATHWLRRDTDALLHTLRLHPDELRSSWQADETAIEVDRYRLLPGRRFIEAPGMTWGFEVLLGGAHPSPHARSGPWDPRPCRIATELGGIEFREAPSPLVALEETPLTWLARGEGDACPHVTVPDSSLAADFQRIFVAASGQHLGQPDVAPSLCSALLAGSADVTLEAEEDGELVRAHRWMLVTRSPHFRRVLGSGLSEATARRVVVHGIDGATLAALVRFLYEDSIPHAADPSRAMSLLVAAKALGEDRLARLCEAALTRVLDADNAAGLLQFGDRYSCADLREAAIAHILAHFQEVSKSGDLDLLGEDLREHLNTIWTSVSHAYAVDAAAAAAAESGHVE